jgi:hypothetical protein
VRRLACAALILAAAACGSDKSTAPKRIEGTYTMQSIDGLGLPMTFYDDQASGGEKVEVLSGSMTLSADGTFSAPWSLRITSDGTVYPYSETCTGTFTRSGNSITRNENNGPWCGGIYDMDWDGDKTLVEEGLIVYTR